MGNNKKDKTPTYTYIKEFKTFAEGYKELTSLIPEVSMYGGEENTYDEVVQNLTNIICENIPSPNNENYPNTLSFSIASKEVGFLTDDSLAFGWKIFINKKDDSLVYQFRVTFITLSMSKRKYIEKITNNGWKEKDISGKQSRFWNDLSNNKCSTYTEQYRQQVSTSKPKKATNAIPVHHESTRSKAMADENNSKGAETNTRVSSGQMVEKREVRTEETMKKNYNTLKESVDKTTKAKVIEHREEAPTTITNQEVKIDNSDEKAIEEANLRARASCSIQRGATPAVFVVTYFGETRVININDRNEGVALDRASRSIKIGKVVYNYDTCAVTFLENDIQHEDAQFLGYIPGKMLPTKKVSDEDLVGGKMEEDPNAPVTTIIAPKHPTGVSSNSLIPPSNTNRIVKSGKNLVINKNIIPPSDDVQYTTKNGVAQQVVKMSDSGSTNY